MAIQFFQRVIKGTKHEITSCTYVHPEKLLISIETWLPKWKYSVVILGIIFKPVKRRININ